MSIVTHRFYSASGYEGETKEDLTAAALLGETKLDAACERGFILIDCHDKPVVLPWHSIVRIVEVESK